VHWVKITLTWVFKEEEEEEGEAWKQIKPTTELEKSLPHFKSHGFFLSRLFTLKYNCKPFSAYCSVKIAFRIIGLVSWITWKNNFDGRFLTQTIRPSKQDTEKQGWTHPTSQWFISFFPTENRIFFPFWCITYSKKKCTFVMLIYVCKIKFWDCFISF